jgi:signal transduction histidine kinase
LPKAPASELPTPTPATKRILVVDDSRTMRLMLRRWLGRSEYSVYEAQNGDEAFEKLKGSEFDLVTVDIDMPVLDGFALCAKLREWEQANARRHTPVLIVTSHDTLADRERGFEVGATDFLAKPVSESELLARVDRLIRTDAQLLGLTALVVDDSRVARKSIAFSLARYGITVIEAEDGLAAFQLLQSRGKEIDLLLTDFDMPNMDGAELCRRARTTLGLPWLPIIILSAMADRSRVLDLFSVGATDYLCKPFTTEELVARISVHVEIRRLNRERARQIAELERLNELKNKLLTIASHDLRSPLNGILGAAGLMLENPQLSENDRELVDVICRSGENLLQIVSDVLDLARMEAGKSFATCETFGLGPLVEEVCRSVQPMAAPKGIVLKRDAGPAAAAVTVHAVRNDVLRLLTNLISNGIKFTPRDGQVTVSTHQLPNGSASIAVMDTGIGIAADKLPLLFDRFSKISQVGTAGELSTGLGMAIVKEIVERHGGTINVTSQLGIGTTVTVTLPSRA